MAKKYDLVIDLFYGFQVLNFLVEIFLVSLVKVEYRFSFFFFLDLVATLCFILDISLIYDLINQNRSIEEIINYNQIGRTQRFTRLLLNLVRLTYFTKYIRLGLLLKIIQRKTKGNAKTVEPKFTCYQVSVKSQ